MAGIASYGAYIPVYRLGKETAGWGNYGEKAVRNFDEDSVTMAVAAARDCLNGLDSDVVDAVIFASTTQPYMEKQSAAIVAEASGCLSHIFTSDCTGSLRAGTCALKLALDIVNAGTAKNVLVTVADCRMGLPKGEFDQSSGDGAAAFLVSKSNVIASIDDIYSITDQIIDVWRPEGDKFITSWEDRFVLDEGYFRIMPIAIDGLLKRNRIGIKDFSKIIFYGSNARRHSDLGKRLDLADKKQIQDPLFGKVGCTGSAFAPMLLVAALENAKPNDKLMMVSYGDGSDAFLLTVTDNIKTLESKRGIKGHLFTKIVLPDYLEYVTGWRGLMPSEANRRPPLLSPSPASLHREESKNIRLQGVKCKSCGTVQFPPQRVCTQCHTKDQFEAIGFSSKNAKLFTYSLDYMSGTRDYPYVITIVDFDGGGRGGFLMTDHDVSKDVYCDAPVEMTFRQISFVGGIHNYHWKTMPLRETIGGLEK